jgi:hypothetical protein
VVYLDPAARLRNALGRLAAQKRHVGRGGPATSTDFIH